MLRLDPIRSRIDRLVGERRVRERTVEMCESAKKNLTEQQADLEKALAILRGLEEETRELFQSMLGDLASHCVSAVFGEDIRIKLVSKTYRDVAALDIVVEQDEMETDIFSAKGGSLVQVVAFALRLVLVVTNPSLRNFMALDEPFAMVSAEYRPRLAALLIELNRELGVQFFIITHEPEMVDAADVAYEVVKDGTKAKARLIKQENEERS